MKPSFLALFKSGRFVRKTLAVPKATDEDSIAVAKKIHKEQERFTAAAVAFCFKHDEKFRNHFWEHICRLEGDPVCPEMRIDIEPPAWADLIVRSESGGKRFSHVIECKIEADLVPHQDPRAREFGAEDGYGGELFKNEGGRQLRYVVLGYRDDLHLPKTHSKLPIQLAERKWEQLEVDYAETPLLTDLLDSLGEMGVGKFRMRTTNKIRITQGLGSVGQVWDVLHATRENVELAGKYCTIDGGRTEGEKWSMGTHVLKLPEKQGASHMQRKLAELTKSTTQYLAWFGYGSDSEERVARELWLYCANDRLASALKERLKGEYPNGRLDTDDDQDCLVLTDIDRAQLGDVEWFSSALRAVESLEV